MKSVLKLLLDSITLFTFVLLLCQSGCKNRSQIEIGTDSIVALSDASEKIVAKITPCVIRIDVAYGRKSVSDELEDFFGTVPSQSQIGSGVIVDAEGWALTNYHVVRGASSVMVTLADGRQSKAEIAGVDPLTDLALLRVSLNRLYAVPWGDPNKAKSGSLVWSFGSPFGMDGSVSFGVISSPARSLYADNPFHDFLQTDALINPGSSGGPLIDVRGQLVGINTAIAGDQFAGVGFSIPANVVHEVYSQLRKHGKVDRAWIGVELANVSQDEAVLAGRPNTAGAVIRSLKGDDSPAERGGLRKGDIILAINGAQTLGPTQALRQIAACKVDQEIDVKYLRKAQELATKIRPIVQPMRQ